jgi:hypothetical protein
MGTAGVLPYLPLRLIHSLAVRQEASGDLDLRLPKPAQLEDVSPLPLPLSVLFSSGVLQAAESTSSLQQSVESYSSSGSGAIQAEVSAATYTNLLAKTVEVCRVIRTAAGQFSYLDIHLALQELDEIDKKSGKALTFIIKGS